MTGERHSFFVSGGTLERNAPCYVKRQADDQLYRGLLRGEFCYVLTSRQMGKSSLMVRTAAQLQEEGYAVVALDLTMAGRNVTVEQWYYGLLSSLAEQLGLRQELRQFWRDGVQLGPAQRWMTALRELVLPLLEERARTESGRAEVIHSPAVRLVIFIDEIDTVRSLPFSTDEFFAAIRECYNRRTRDPVLHRLTFCLLGVAAPSDLIADTRTTPFNIGQRIDLTDFTAEEAYPFRVGLCMESLEAPSRTRAQAEALLARVFYWTGGHPYLTQRLCQAVAADLAARQPRDVDRHCAELFLTPAAAERDDNLLFARTRMLKSEVDLARLLLLYGRIRRSEDGLGRQAGRVRNDPASPLVEVLQLSGVVRDEHGFLRVRNRIYSHVFDRVWIAENLPDAELRRQRAELRRKVLRIVALVAVVVAVTGGLSVVAVRALREAGERRRAVEVLEYAANTSQAKREIDRGSFTAAAALLEKSRPRRGGEDLRGWEWRYLWGVSHQELATLAARDAGAASVSFLDEGVLATVGEDQARLWEVPSGAAKSSFSLEELAPETYLTGAVLSPDGRLVASSIATTPTRSPQEAPKLPEIRWRVRVRRLGEEKPFREFSGTGAMLLALTFSADGSSLFAGGVCHRGGEKGMVWRLDWQNGAAAELGLQPMAVTTVAGSPDGRLIACGDRAGFVTVRTAGGRPAGELRLHGSVHSLAFRDARTLAAAGGVRTPSPGSGEVVVWDLREQRTRARHSHGRCVRSVVFSPDGGTVAFSGDDPTIYFWSFGSGGKVVPARVGHEQPVTSLGFSPEGGFLASADTGGTARIWAGSAGEHYRELPGDGSPVYRAALSKNTGSLALLGASELRICETATGRELCRHKAVLPPLAISPNGRLVAFGYGASVRFCDVGSGNDSPVLQTGRPVSGLVFSDRGDVLAVGCEGGSIRLWNPQTRQSTLLPGRQSRVSALAFSPDGTKLVTGSAHDPLVLWDVRTRRPVAKLGEGSDGPVVFSPDGRWLAFASGSRIVLRSQSSGDRRLLEGSGSSSACLAFSPDGRTLAVGSDRVVKLWSTVSGGELYDLQGVRGARAVEFAPGGDTLVCVGADGTLHFWKAPELR